ncbi:MAG: pyruvate, orthophosphate dikinase [Candidatus Methanocomedens sp.]|nr:MAG: pyruvate, orthophosphate dikinase [ANME-2 cluster archaeon]
MPDHKYVYFFGKDKTEGNATMRNLLGGKGSHLAEMANLGIPVPPGFTITTKVCTEYFENQQQYPDGVKEQIAQQLAKLEDKTGFKFGDDSNPLLLSVRSGARISMPGMMDTVLNLGLNDKTVAGLAEEVDERFAYDCYRRFINMFGDVVLGIEHKKFENILGAKKKELGVENDTELDAVALKDVSAKYMAMVEEKTGQDFPQDPMTQLWMSINAVFDSWNTPRAIKYRKIHGIPDDWGTAVNVQFMVYGNMGENSGTGVAFTRNPSTGERKFYGEYLMNAQGEDVVAGIRTPHPIEALNQEMPEMYAQLDDIKERLEHHFKEMEDIEFTIQQGKLYMLQTRTGKRTAAAAVRIAIDMFNEGLITKDEALLKVDPEQLDQLLHPMIDPNEKVDAIAKGLPASPGAGVGKVVFTAEHAEEMAEAGEKVVLVRNETSPEDIGGMHVAQGILTVRGGMTSHAAVVARGMGKCCVAGCGAILIDEDAGLFTVNGHTVKEGDFITLNGTTGEVIIGQAKLITPDISGDLNTILDWADDVRTLGVRTNADTPEDSLAARDFGAEGIGLCRTEHMFFGEDRIPIVQDMILAETEDGRKAALKKLLPMQRSDFKGIFEAMKGYPVTIRLLDPPLHEFLPKHDELMEQYAKLKAAGDTNNIHEIKDLIKRVNSLHEFNPMLGHRGCRLGITYPEIYEMQVRAIFESACELVKDGYEIVPEVMIPLVGHINEFKVTRDSADAVAKQVMEEQGVELDYMIGTMIELPRAAITADEIATEAEFFSFGTNDLTQTTFGLSRDDAGKFLPYYVEIGILENDPFVAIDQDGVGQLVKMGVDKGRSSRPDLKIGICGEHGGEPGSVIFCHNIGLDYVSCSPFRVPIARLAAAHAVLKKGE